MEIKFNNVSLIKNNKEPFSKTVVLDLNMEIASGTINVICKKDNASSIGKTICALENINFGNIKYKSFNISANTYISNINELRKDIGFVYSNPLNYLFNFTVLKEIEYGIKGKKNISSKSKEAIKMLGLNENILEKNPLKLSFSEQKKSDVGFYFSIKSKRLNF